MGVKAADAAPHKNDTFAYILTSREIMPVKHAEGWEPEGSEGGDGGWYVEG